MSEKGLICSGAGGGTRTPDPRITKTDAGHEGRDSSGFSGAIHSGGQSETALNGAVPVQNAAQVLEAGLLPIPVVALALGLNVKRLRGYVWRNGIPDPIGSLETDQVYGWSCRELARRADMTDAVVSP